LRGREPTALCEAPFNSIHTGGADELFADKPNIIDSLFHGLEGNPAEGDGGEMPPNDAASLRKPLQVRKP
jgi:hypothetical protein